MRKINPIALTMVLASSLCLNSCSTASKFSSSKTLDITANVNQKPTLVDLDVKDVKISATATGRVGTVTFETVKSDAVSMAIKAANADILVEPKYETITKGSDMTVTVTGYPGFYKNFRVVKTEDVPILESLIYKTGPVMSATQPASILAPLKK